MFFNIFQSYTQHLASLAASLSSIAGGNLQAWPSLVLPQLQSANSPLGKPLDSMEVSLVTSSFLLGTTTGYIFTGIIPNKIGRRNSILITGIPMAIGWLLIYFFKNLALLCVDRFFMGLLYAIPYMASMVYITEITEPKNRGKLFVAVPLMLEFGSLMATLLGSYVSYDNIALICFAVPIIYFLAMLPFPESPYYFLKKGDYKSAENSLRIFRRGSISKEILEIDNSIQEDMKNQVSVKDLLFGKEFRRELLIVLALKTLHQFCGQHAIIAYMGVIFQTASTGLDAATSSIICTSVTIPSMLLAGFVIDKFGRKPLYYVSTIGCTVALLMEFSYFLLQDSFNMDMADLGWLPVTGIFLFYIFRTFGITTLSPLIMAELFPTNVKAAAIAFTLFYSGLSSFIVAFGFPLLNDFWGIAYSFLLFAIICLLGFFFILFFVPETKGKSLAEIQAELKKNRQETEKPEIEKPEAEKRF